VAAYVKVIVYSAAAIWAVALLVSGQQLSPALWRPISSVTSAVVLLSIAFELWLWKLRFLHGWLVKRPVIEGTWRAELRSNWKGASGALIPPIEGYAVIRQTLFNLSIRLMTQESSSKLVGTEIVCSADGLYCISGVYRNEPQFRLRNASPIHYGAVWLEVVYAPKQMLKGHYWTDRNTAGEITLADRRKDKFQDFESAKACYTVSASNGAEPATQPHVPDHEQG
jgi:hypothetical protein